MKMSNPDRFDRFVFMRTCDDQSRGWFSKLKADDGNKIYDQVAHKAHQNLNSKMIFKEENNSPSYVISHIFSGDLKRNLKSHTCIQLPSMILQNQTKTLMVLIVPRMLGTNAMMKGAMNSWWKVSLTNGKESDIRWAEWLQMVHLIFHSILSFFFLFLFV